MNIAKICSRDILFLSCNGKRKNKILIQIYCTLEIADTYAAIGARDTARTEK